jgi:hypothetical protein
MNTRIVDHKGLRAACALPALALALCWTAPVSAQEAPLQQDMAAARNSAAPQPDTGQLDDIVVTARYSNENLQETPLGNRRRP